MKTELISISKIKPNPDNPRIIKDDKFRKLVQSIKDFPEMMELRPIVVNSEMVVLGGNMRLKACKEAKLSEVHIIRASNLTEEQQREFIIKDNVGFGEWEWDELANNWNVDNLEDWGLDTHLFNQEDINEVTDFNESTNFTIKCIDLKQLEELQSKLNTSSQKLKYDDFIIKARL